LDELAQAQARSGIDAIDDILAVRGLTKRYGAIVALDSLDLAVERGRVHAVVGENGAGKSTLMRILAGAETPDSGCLYLNGKPASFKTPMDARSHGIAIVYQELSLFPHRSVAANLFIASEPTRRGLVARGRMDDLAERALRQVLLEVDPRERVSKLSIGERQRVEICRALLRSPRVLILDEPNSALNSQETDHLFAVLRELRGKGMTIIYVSHRLEEVLTISDWITVIRDGHHILTGRRGEFSVPIMVRAMLGSDKPLERVLAKQDTVGNTKRAGGPPLRLSGLTGASFRDVSLAARPGEIVGLVGLEGSGARELLHVLAGNGRAKSGSAEYPDGQGLPRHPVRAARRGICLVPADRRREGLMIERPVAFNLGHVTVGALPRSFWVSRAELGLEANRQMAQLRIKAASPWSRVDELSGGNQQKVVIGKWVASKPRVLLLDDPTRGIDIGAKHELYEVIRRLASENQLVLMTSSELPTLRELATRLLVFYRGKVVVDGSTESIAPDELLRLINSGSPEDAAPPIGARGGSSSDGRAVNFGSG
jgi:ribose transport system ATP-binding protein